MKKQNRMRAAHAANSQHSMVLVRKSLETTAGLSRESSVHASERTPRPWKNRRKRLGLTMQEHRWGVVLLPNSQTGKPDGAEYTEGLAKGVRNK